MKNINTQLLILLLVPFLGACSNGWSKAESALINEASYSRMRVLTVDHAEDSLLLRTPSAPLTRREVASEEFGRLVASMIETVNDPQNAGVGIAAPQVGILRRVVVVQRVDRPGTPFEVYVNPEIVAYGDHWAAGGEGCLSVPNARGEVERAQSIRLAWRDAVTFQPREELIEGFAAVIFQHEIDHLDGTLYTDRATSITPDKEN